MITDLSLDYFINITIIGLQCFKSYFVFSVVPSLMVENTKYLYILRPTISNSLLKILKEYCLLLNTLFNRVHDYIYILYM